MASIVEIPLSFTAASGDVTLTMPNKGEWELIGVRFNLFSQTGSAANATLRLGAASGFTNGTKEQFYESDSISMAALPINNDDNRASTGTIFTPDACSKIYARLTLNTSDTVVSYVSVYAVPYRGER